MSLSFKFNKNSGGERMPTLPIRLLNEDEQVITDSQIALVDTGADGTIFPLSILQGAGLRPNRQRRNLFTVQFSTPEETLFGYSVILQSDGVAPLAHLYIRRVVSHYVHPVGTARMGPDGDPGAVVDQWCRVRGVSQLRVVSRCIYSG